MAEPRVSEYLLRGELVSVPVRWNGKANPDLPRLQAALPLVRLKPHGPRNALVAWPDGRVAVRPFRGLRRLPGSEPVAGDCGDGYGWQPPARPVDTVQPVGGVL